MTTTSYEQWGTMSLRLDHLQHSGSSLTQSHDGSVAAASLLFGIDNICKVVITASEMLSCCCQTEIIDHNPYLSSNSNPISLYLDLNHMYQNSYIHTCSITHQKRSYFVHSMSLSHILSLARCGLPPPTDVFSEEHASVDARQPVVEETDFCSALDCAHASCSFQTASVEEIPWEEKHTACHSRMSSA